jgi:hypothetical protein
MKEVMVIKVKSFFGTLLKRVVCFFLALTLVMSALIGMSFAKPDIATAAAAGDITTAIYAANDGVDYSKGAGGLSNRDSYIYFGKTIHDGDSVAKPILWQAMGQATSDGAVNDGKLYFYSKYSLMQSYFSNPSSNNYSDPNILIRTNLEGIVNGAGNFGAIEKAIMSPNNVITKMHFYLTGYERTGSKFPGHAAAATYPTSASGLKLYLPWAYYRDTGDEANQSYFDPYGTTAAENLIGTSVVTYKRNGEIVFSWFRSPYSEAGGTGLVSDGGGSVSQVAMIKPHGVRPVFSLNPESIIYATAISSVDSANAPEISPDANYTAGGDSAVNYKLTLKGDAINAGSWTVEDVVGANAGTAGRTFSEKQGQILTAEVTDGSTADQLAYKIVGTNDDGKREIVKAGRTVGAANSIAISTAGLEVGGNYEIYTWEENEDIVGSVNSYVASNLEHWSLEVLPRSHFLNAFAESKTVTYNGQGQGLTNPAVLSGVPVGTSFKYMTTVPGIGSSDFVNWGTNGPLLTNAGVYKITIQAINDTYNTSEAAVTLTINPKTISAGDVQWSGTNSAIYTGNSQSPVVATAAGVGSEVLNFTLGGGGQANAADYMATAAGILSVTGGQGLASNYSYTANSADTGWRISAGAFPQFARGRTVTYNGVGQGLSNPAVVAGTYPDSASTDYKYMTNAPGVGAEWTDWLDGTSGPLITNAGLWTITVQAINTNGSYVQSEAAVTLTINPKTIPAGDVQWSGTCSAIYNGGTQSPVTATASGVNGEVVNFTLSGGSQTNADNYMTTASGISSVTGGQELASNYSYTANSANTAWAISPMPITAENVKWAATNSAIYNGETHSPVATAGGVNTEVVNFTIVGGSETNAASYMATASAISTVTNGHALSANYSYTANSADTAWKISPKLVSAADVIWSGTNSAIYNGMGQSPVATAAGIGSEIVNFTITGGNQTDASDYMATASGISSITGGQGNKDNYIYSATSDSTQWRIKKTPASAVDITFESDSKKFNGNAQALAAATATGFGDDEFTISYTIDGTNYYPDIPTRTAVGPLLVTARAINENYDYAYKSATLTITADDLQAPFAAARTLTYNGVGQGLTNPAVIAGIYADSTSTTYKYMTNAPGASGTLTDWLLGAPGPLITNAGIWTVTIQAINPNYNISTAAVTLRINPKPISAGNVQWSAMDTAIYNGMGQSPVATAAGIGTEIVNFTIRGGNQTDAGDYMATASGISSVTGGQGNKDNYIYAATSDSTYWRIKKAPASAVDITFESDSKKFNGNAQALAAATATGFGDDEFTISYTIDGTSYYLGIPTMVSVGSLLVMARAINENYDYAYKSATLTVTAQGGDGTPDLSVDTDGSGNPGDNNTAAPLIWTAAPATQKLVASKVMKSATPLKKVYLSKKKSLTPAVLGYDSKNKSSKGTLTLKSSKTKIVKVSGKKLKALKKTGSATITVWVKDKVLTQNREQAVSGGAVVYRNIGPAITTYVERRVGSFKAYVVKKAVKIKKAKAKLSKTMKRNQIKQIELTVSPSKATNLKVTFKSSKKKGLSVDKAGMVTAKKKGKYTLTVKAGTKSVKLKVKVK